MGLRPLNRLVCRILDHNFEPTKRLVELHPDPGACTRCGEHDPFIDAFIIFGRGFLDATPEETAAFHARLKAVGGTAEQAAASLSSMLRTLCALAVAVLSVPSLLACSTNVFPMNEPVGVGQGGSSAAGISGGTDDGLDTSGTGDELQDDASMPGIDGVTGGTAGTTAGAGNEMVTGGAVGIGGAAGASSGGSSGASGSSGVGGALPNLCSGIDCDDGDACTVDECALGTCSHEPVTADGVACFDGHFDGTCAPSTGVCEVTCGGLDEDCCAGEACYPDRGIGCLRPPSGQMMNPPKQCLPCGGEEERCCPGDECEGRLLCGVPYEGVGILDRCYACGAVGEQCCNETPEGGDLVLTCEAGLTCAITSAGGVTGSECRD